MYKITQNNYLCNFTTQKRIDFKPVFIKIKRMLRSIWSLFKYLLFYMQDF